MYCIDVNKFEWNLSRSQKSEREYELLVSGPFGVDEFDSIISDWHSKILDKASNQWLDNAEDWIKAVTPEKGWNDNTPEQVVEEANISSPA